MKKIIALILVLAVFLSFTACEKNEAPSDDEYEDEPSYEEYEDYYEDGHEDDYEEPPAEENEYGFDVTPTIEETLLYNENGIKITAKALTYSYYNACVELLFENSNDADWSYSTPDVSEGYVNHVSYSGFFFGTIPANSSVTEKVEYGYYALALNGVKVIKEICLDVTLNDPDWVEYNTGAFILKTSAYEENTYDENGFSNVLADSTYTEITSETVLFSEKCDVDLGGGVKMITKAVTEDEFSRYLVAEFVNNSDKPVSVSICNIAVNGVSYAENGHTYVTISPYCGCIFDYSLNFNLSSEALDALGMGDFGILNFSVATHIPDDFLNDFAVVYDGSVKLDGKPTSPSFQKTQVYNKNSITVSLLGIYPADWEGEANIICYVENNFGSSITFELPEPEIILNGSDATCYLDWAVLPNGFNGLLVFSVEDLESLGLESYEDISSFEMSLGITDYDSFKDIDSFEFTYGG